MEKTRNTKTIAIIALITAIVGLSVGFAAFSTALNISTDQSTVRPDDTTFVVKFSSSESDVSESSVNGEVSDSSVMSATAASISNSDPTNPVVTNLSGTFTKPGQTITYTFYIHNTGNYDAYLTGIDFLDIENESYHRICAPADDEDGASNDLVQIACEDIYMEVTFEGNNTDSYTETDHNISSHYLERGSHEKVIVTLHYDGDNDSTTADGEFTVDFGGIELTYSSVDN